MGYDIGEMPTHHNRLETALNDAALSGVLPTNRLPLIAELGETADPEFASIALIRIASAASSKELDILREILHDDDATDDVESIPNTELFPNTGFASGPETNPDSGHSPRKKLLAVLGGSSALTEEIVRRPELLQVLCNRPTSVGGIVGVCKPVIVGEMPAGEALAVVVEQVLAKSDDRQNVVAAATDALRRAYRAELLKIAAADLASDPLGSFPETAARLTKLAEVSIAAALSITEYEIPAANQVRFAVIAMGKTGGRELNYVSDVDVLYVAEPRERSNQQTNQQTSQQLGHQIATALSRIISAPGPEPALWPLDLNLRPEGHHGPLVRNLDSYRIYYEKWAQNWEFQALLKSRAIAGDAELGAQFRDLIRPLVWQATTREGFVADTQGMRSRVETGLTPKSQNRQIKLGPGGLRDIEFTVQLLQLIHGRADESVRHRNTLEALASLRDGGYVGRDDAAALDAAYRFLRALEHRMQLTNLKRVSELPKSDAQLRRLGRSLGSEVTGRITGQRSADALLAKVRDTRREVRALQQNLFFRPLLPAYAQLSDSDITLTPEAARARLTAIGYRDPEGALRHIAALTLGTSRRAALQRQLLPVMLGWFGQTFDPDQGLLAFRQLSEAAESAPWYLRLLRDSGTAAQWLVDLLGNSRYLAETVTHGPEAVRWLAEPEIQPLDWDRLVGEADALLSRAETPDAAITAIRALRRRELTRLAAAEVLGEIDRVQAAAALSDLADLTLMSGLRVAREVARERLGLACHPAEILLIALGRLGGRELSYGSDADIMFCYEPSLNDADVDPNLVVVTPTRAVVAHANSRAGTHVETTAAEYANLVAALVTELLGTVGSEPPLLVDLDLRPEGKQGPITRSLESYREYYSRWMQPWEAQALLRARPLSAFPSTTMATSPASSDGRKITPSEPEEGDTPLKVSDHRDALASKFLAMINQYRYPTVGLKPDQVAEIRRLKARLEATRLPRGVDPARHLKFGPGGLADVEWTVQLLQLQHAGEHPGLRTTSTAPAIVE
ncbi:MAG: bifunctional [glutamine synthetase] adenylyltransferase/[glutamine synthetase]-adenylyl-L-tyrosine phosphorylase, partial [Promicromonosporaceae bacterium]|nr:bifunctional [glutamine synthetase] adenylyltransferase/[glutamine synthetase]-adenylyl-L-tyrosine phosphorylase [Promicromonosporaceae bacterium]